MDLDDFRTIVETTGFDVWAFINAAIEVAALDDINELKKRRDSIVQKLYTVQLKRCRNCDLDRNSPNEEAKVVNVVVDDDDDDDKGDGNGNGVDPFGGLFDDEPKNILEIKAMLGNSELGEDVLVEMLQSLADMDITFQALKETDIGRNVNKLRKHPSNEVRRLVKQLVRKWKETVDEWVSMNQPGEVGSSALMDGDSPQPKLPQNGHHQVPDFGYSPNPQNGSSGSDRNNFEPERKPKPVPRKETPMRHKQQSPASASTPNRQREQKDNAIDSDRLASARKRLQENYKEAENAKKQRTIQVMDIHEIPKSRNGFVKKGGGSIGRHW